MRDDETTTRARARRRALQAARAVTLGLAVAAGAAGCDRVGAIVCRVYSNNSYCCEHHGYGMWNSTTHTCESIAVPGPFVPPDLASPRERVA